MSLYNELNKTSIGTRERLLIHKALVDFYRLQLYMNAQESIQGILKLLRVELEGLNRISYVKRIYSRYASMKKHHDIDKMHNWSRTHGKG